ncbi:MAG: hypothetical protein BWZ04_02150 [Firmicutes bacterium ADurb.BinA205]|nr:MAG: hypothetical protein BWZ04_02150 [Firmicutes bacterium ADurb.BinA205]
MKKSVCFTGHRTIAEDKEKLSARLYALLERLVTEKKVTDFYTGGAVGWDALAALTVLKLRESYPEVKLHLVLPCPFEEQSAKWKEAQKTEYLHILGLADSVEQVSDRYYNGCMKARNARLVELASDYCICYWNPNNFRSGTGQTVRMAQKKGIEVINLFEMSANSVKSPDKRLTDDANSSIMDISNHLEVSTMPRKKKTETAPIAEVKAEVVTEAVKETVAEAPAEKPAKKPDAKKAPAKKTATKTPAKAAEKKTTAKTTRATAPVETVKVQFGGDEYDFAEIKKAVEADYKSKFKGKVKTIEFYIKPEDKAVYYVINGDFSDKIEL